MNSAMNFESQVVGESCAGLSECVIRDIECDFEIWCVGAPPIKTHSFLMQAFCRNLSFKCQGFHIEDREIKKEDVECVLKFMYERRTTVQVPRMKAVKKVAFLLGYEEFLEHMHEAVRKPDRPLIFSNNLPKNIEEPFSRSSSILRNLMEKDRVKCGQCSFTCSREYELRVHESLNHEHRPFSCSNCSESFLRESELNSHVRSEHAPLTCNFCGMQFETMILLKNHEEEHSAVKSIAWEDTDGQDEVQSAVNSISCEAEGNEERASVIINGQSIEVIDID